MKNLISCFILLVTLVFSASNANASPQAQVHLFPSDTRMIVQLDFEALKGTKLFKEVVSSTPQYGQMVAQFKSQSGVDISTQLKTVTIGFFNDATPNPMAVILDAPFPKNPKGTKEKKMIGKYTYYTMGNGPAVAPYKGAILMTDEQYMKRFLGAKNGITGNLANLSKARDSKAQVWIFGAPPPQMAQRGAKEIAKVSGINAALSFRSGIDLNAVVNMDQVMAKEMVTQYEASKAQMMQNPMMMMMGLGAVINNLKVSAAGQVLTAKLKLNEAELGQLMNMVKMMVQQRAGAGMKAPGQMRAPGQMPAPMKAPAPGGITIPKAPK
jgi:hypothetical protein